MDAPWYLQHCYALYKSESRMPLSHKLGFKHLSPEGGPCFRLVHLSRCSWIDLQRDGDEDCVHMKLTSEVLIIRGAFYS
jgi:hypothetical protein